MFLFFNGMEYTIIWNVVVAAHPQPANKLSIKLMKSIYDQSQKLVELIK